MEGLDIYLEYFLFVAIEGKFAKGCHGVSVGLVFLLVVKHSVKDTVCFCEPTRHYIATQILFGIQLTR